MIKSVEFNINFRYNEYEKPSSKSYMAPVIKEIEIIKYSENLLADDKVEFRVWINEKENNLSDAAIEQLTLFFMNKHNIKNYSDISLTIIGNEENNNV